MLLAKEASILERIIICCFILPFPFSHFMLVFCPKNFHYFLVYFKWKSKIFSRDAKHVLTVNVCYREKKKVTLTIVL